MIFLNKTLQPRSFLLMMGMKQRFLFPLSLSPPLLIFKAVMLGLWLVTVLKFSI